jgi:hypothetical protein
MESDSYDLYVHVLCAHRPCGILFLLCTNMLEKVRIRSVVSIIEMRSEHCKFRNDIFKHTRPFTYNTSQNRHLR